MTFDRTECFIFMYDMCFIRVSLYVGVYCLNGWPIWCACTNVLCACACMCLCTKLESMILTYRSVICASKNKMKSLTDLLVSR